MSSLYESFSAEKPPKVSQVTGSPTLKTLAGIDQLIVLVPKRMPAALWNKVPQAAKVKALMRRSAPGSVPVASTRLANQRQTAIHVGQADPSADTFELLTLARKMVAATSGEKTGMVGLWVLGFGDDQERIAGYLLSAALAAAFRMPAYKEKPAPARFRGIRVLGMEARADFGRVIAEAEGNNLARFLTAQPSNKLDAGAFVDMLKRLAQAEGWQFRKFGVSELRKHGAGAFLAVAQGNADDSAAIVRLRYRPGAKTATPELSLVGKGIIFDTGGTNLKPFTSMLDMHIDMGGAAVAVGTLLTMTRLRLDMPVDAWLAITENRTGPTAYKPQDVVTALNGKTIQTIHTDAEGRMALADTLTMACEDKPNVIIDYATLTGACMNAVTTRYSGVFTNRPDLHPVLRKAGRACGERVWPFPIGKEFLEELKSETADIMQCAPNGGGDHILASSFLNEFVDDDVSWVHVDLSACQRKGGLAHVPTAITGFGVRLSMALVIDSGIAGSDR